jgi:hypothetical protein
MALFGKKKDGSVQEITKQKLIAYKQVFSSPQGKEVLFDLMNSCNILNSHRGDAFSEGRRSVALDILHKMNVNEQQLSDMLKGD